VTHWTSHFQSREFRCPHCQVALARDLLLQRLEVLRASVGRPLVIRSGYRCPPHNAAVGGAADSMHMYAAAADLESGVATLDDARRAGFTGVGTQGRWAVHVDVRDGPFETWQYGPRH